MVAPPRVELGTRGFSVLNDDFHGDSLSNKLLILLNTVTTEKPVDLPIFTCYGPHMVPSNLFGGVIKWRT